MLKGYYCSMAKIGFPNQLKLLLEDSDLQASIRILADRVGENLSDNKRIFFRLHGSRR